MSEYKSVIVSAGSGGFGSPLTLTPDEKKNKIVNNIPRLLVDPKDPHGKYKLDGAVFDKVTAVNLKGVYLCAQAVGRELVAQGHGVTYNVAGGKTRG